PASFVSCLASWLANTSSQSERTTGIRVYRAIGDLFSASLGELLSTQVIVENRAGANATIAADFVAKAAPDGYTLFLGSTSSLVISPHTYSKLSYDTLRDFAPVTTVAMTPEALAIHPSLPARDLKSLVALARANPGKMDFASSGSGGLPHLALELFKTQANINLQHVPYKGAAPAVADLVGGHVQGMFMDFPAIYPQLKSGKMRPIALAAEKRIAQMPELPTTGEQGMPSVIAVNWFAIMAPAKTPAAVVSRLHSSLINVMGAADIRERLTAVGVESYTRNSPDAFAAFLRDELVRWGKVAKASGARAD
ncbi:MAG: tripartite tricarboxylate transporter substrate binding protein, partial [Betaproteobacteria bacterium]|nr:tripartite tricarboxylate transporter substrate binding protein [Betaproteobacteria bacterium]